MVRPFTMHCSKPRVTNRTLVRLSRTENKAKIMKCESWYPVLPCGCYRSNHMHKILEGTLDSLKLSEIILLLQ